MGWCLGWGWRRWGKKPEAAACERGGSGQVPGASCRLMMQLPPVGLEPGASRPASESAVLLITGLSSKPVPEPRAAPGCRATQPGMAQNLEQHPYSILPWQVSNPRLPRQWRQKTWKLSVMRIEPTLTACSQSIRIFRPLC